MLHGNTFLGKSEKMSSIVGCVLYAAKSKMVVGKISFMPAGTQYTIHRKSRTLSGVSRGLFSRRVSTPTPQNMLPRKLVFPKMYPMPDHFKIKKAKTSRKLLLYHKIVNKFVSLIESHISLLGADQSASWS